MICMIAMYDVMTPVYDMIIRDLIAYCNLVVTKQRTSRIQDTRHKLDETTTT